MKRRISLSHRYEMSYERHDWDEIEAIHATIWNAYILMRECRNLLPWPLTSNSNCGLL